MQDFMRTLEVSLWFCPNFILDISKKIGARTAKPSKNLRNQRLLGSQKISNRVIFYQKIVFFNQKRDLAKI